MAKRPNKVRLYIRCLADGRYSFFAPVWNRNGALRAGYAQVDGQPAFHTEGTYYLRFVRGGKRVWQAVGADADAALAALRRTEHRLNSIALGLALPDPAPTPESIATSEGVSFDGAIETYVDRLGLPAGATFA